MSLAEPLLDEFGQQIKGLTLIPASGGVFEVTINGDLIYSKKRVGRFPSVEEIRRELRSRATA